MFERLTSLAVRRWPFVLVTAAFFCLFGWDRFRSLPIEAFPDVTDPMVEVIGSYPGQAADEVERRVTIELERVLAGTPRLVNLRSVSVFGLSLVTLTFAEGTPDFERRTLVAERLREAELPKGAETIMGPQATPVGQIYRYTLSGPRSLRELRALQDFVVERRLRAVPGVADVVTFGGFERQYQVRIDPARLAGAGVSIREVHEALSKANENAGGGYVGVGSQELVVRGLGAIQRPEDLGQAVVRSTDGVPIRIRDVADIVEGSTPRRGAVGRGDNDEVVEGIVLLRRGENPSVVLDALHQRVQQLNTDILPRDVRLSTFYDRTTLVSATLRTVGKNMTEGALLVLAVVYLFLRTLRAVIIVAVVIPVSMLAAFVGLSFMGLPANLISLGAIDFGILVDGAIIVVESTLHLMERRDHSEEPRSSLVERATTLVAGPVGFSMLIIIVALVPIFTLERVEGRIFAPMAFTYAFALLGALLCALALVPALEALLLRGKVRTEEPRWLRLLGDRYATLLTRLEPWRGRVITAFAAAAACMAVFGSSIGTEFLPELNEGGFYVTAVFPSTISLDETRTRVREIRTRILRTLEVRDVLSHVGRPEDATQAEGPNNAEFFVVLAPESEWTRGVDRRGLEAELRRRLEEVPGVQYNFSQPITDRVFETISGIIGQVVVKVRGSNLEDMTATAEQVRERLAKVRGITDLALYQAGSVPSLRISLDREALARRGLSVEDVQRTIRIALGGEVATEVWQDEQRFAVALRMPDQVRSNPEALGRVLVGDPAAGVSLGEVARIDTSQERSSVWREDFTRFVAVKFNVRGRDLGSTVTEARASAQGISMSEGTYLTWSGEFQNQERAMRRLGVTLPLALAGIVGILFASFRRWRPTLAIVAFLPVAVVGAVGGLRLLGENFSVSSAVGCIALLGQVVLAGVTICARIDAAQTRGARDPRIEGARDAFRPVLLTTALALLGLLPAATSHATGSETQRPFAIAIVAGLLVVAPAILLLLPLVYRGSARRAAPLLAGLCALFLAPPAGARDSLSPSETTFTLKEAQTLLQQGHPRVASAISLEEAASFDVTTAGLWTNPQLSLDYVQGVTHSSYDPLGVAIVGVSQFVELRDVPGARRDVARHLEDASRAEREGMERELMLELEAAFVALAAQRHIVVQSERRVNDLTRASSIVEARVAAGTMSGFAARRIALERAEARAELERARSEYTRLRGEFDVALGPLAPSLSGHPAMEISDLPTLPPLEPLLHRALQERRDLVALEARQKSALADVTLARRSVFPGLALRLFGGYGQATGQWDLGVGVSLPLPLVDRGQSAISAAESRARAANQLADAFVLEARQRITAAYRTAEQKLDATLHFIQETQGAETGLTAEAEAQFREGRFSVLELVDGVLAADRIAVRRLELARDAHLAEIQLRRLVEVGR